MYSCQMDLKLYSGLTFCVSSPPAEVFREINISIWANLRANWHQTSSSPFYRPPPHLSSLTSKSTRPVYSHLTLCEDDHLRLNGTQHFQKPEQWKKNGTFVCISNTSLCAEAPQDSVKRRKKKYLLKNMYAAQRGGQVLRWDDDNRCI